MKRVLYFLAIIPVISFSQMQTDENDNLYFEKVYEVGLSQEKIKSNVNEWVATSFNDANNVIKMNTSDKIIAKGIFNIENVYKGFSSNLEIHYDLITEFKENRYKILIENLIIKNMFGGDMPLKKEFITMDEYKIYTLKFASEMGTLKAMKRIMESYKYLELYNNSQASYNINLKNVENRLVGMAENINSAVQSSIEKSDW